MIIRQATATLLQLAQGYPILAITGPRQSGKTTLARSTFPDKRYLSLEDPDERLFAEEDPRRFLARFPDGAILDEAQRCPALFSYLQTTVDHDHRMGLYVLTGSQQFGLMSSITQSLAGRVGMIQLLPFSCQELRQSPVALQDIDELLWRGLYPPLYDRPLMPAQWFSNYVATYIERDVRQLLEVRNLSLFQRFLRMCAARCGQLLNLTSLSNDCGINQSTARQWLTVLEASYITYTLQPHHQNFGKRLVKTPKLYFHDTGLAAHLLGIQDADHLSIHPARGALFENLIISEFLKQRYNHGLSSNLYFWRNNTGDEIDVIIEHAQHLQPIEIKSGQTFSSDHIAGLRKWMALARTAAQSPQLVYGGNEDIMRGEIEVKSWRSLA